MPVTHRVDDVIATGAELGVVVAFGRLIRPHVLAAVPMINMHFSLLPRWRGAAPVERAMLAGDAVTGVCIMDVDDELDTGDIYASAEVPIGDTTTADELRARLVDVGTELLLDVVAGALPTPAAAGRRRRPTPRSSRPRSGELDWPSRRCTLHRWVRAGHAWTTFRGKRLRVARRAGGSRRSRRRRGRRRRARRRSRRRASPPAAARCGSSRVQPEGSSAMPWRDFANGARPEAGERLG